MHLCSNNLSCQSNVLIEPVFNEALLVDWVWRYHVEEVEVKYPFDVISSLICVFSLEVLEMSCSDEGDCRDLSPVFLKYRHGYECNEF